MSYLGDGSSTGSTPWISQNAHQQNLPSDSVPGINTYGFDTSHLPAVPFWDQLLDTLDPTNQRFSPWDTVRLAGQQLPGLCAITKGKRGKRFDIKKVKGQNWGRITFQGFDFADFTIIERIWTPQQLDALRQIMPLLELPVVQNKDGTLTATDIEHPALTLRGISSVVIKGIGLLRPTSGVKGCWEQEIECLEYKPIKAGNVTGTVDKSTPYNVATVTNQQQLFTPGNLKLSGSSSKFTGPKAVPGG